MSYARTWAGRQNEIYSRLVEEARRVADQEERMKLYQQANRILIEEAPILPLACERDHLLIQPWVNRYPTAALETSFWKDIVIEPHE